MLPPELFVEKVIGSDMSPLHFNWLAGRFTWPVGFIVIVNVCEEPGQLVPPLEKTGVTVIVAVTGDVPELIAVKELMFPDPFAGSPMGGRVLVQE